MPTNTSPFLHSLLTIIASLRLLQPINVSPFLHSLLAIVASLPTLMPFIASLQTLMPTLLHYKRLCQHYVTPNTYASIVSLRILSVHHSHLTDHQASLILFNRTTFMVFFLLSDSPSIHLWWSFRLTLTMVFFNKTTLMVFFNLTMVFSNKTTLMVFFNPTILMVFFSPTTGILFVYTYSFTGMNSYGEIVPPFLIK